MYIRTSSRDLRNKSLRWQLISINPSVGLNPCIYCIAELLVWPWQLTVFVAFPFRSGDGCGAWLGNNLSERKCVWIKYCSLWSLLSKLYSDSSISDTSTGPVCVFLCIHVLISIYFNHQHASIISIPAEPEKCQGPVHCWTSPWAQCAVSLAVGISW